MALNIIPPVRRGIKCSCCHVTGHNIQHCNSPQVVQFYIDATTASISATTVENLKLMRPFTNADINVLKAVTRQLKLDTAVSNLSLDYLICLLAYAYWNTHNPAGTHLVNPDTAKRAANVAVREIEEARIATQRIIEQLRTRARHEEEALAALNRFKTGQRINAELTEDTATLMRCARQAYERVGWVLPSSMFIETCLCCKSTEHNISDCNSDTTYGLVSMIKILAVVLTERDFRRSLQQHPNIYVWLAIAHKHRYVPIECRDSVLAMDKITHKFYDQQYVFKHSDIRAYIDIFRNETVFQEIDVVYDPRYNFYKLLISTAYNIQTNCFQHSASYVTDCVNMFRDISQYKFTPYGVILNVKEITQTNKDESKDQDPIIQEPECAVCYDCRDIKCQLVSFGCKHEMCSGCLTSHFKSHNQPVCHLCRQAIKQIYVPTESINDELFHEIRVRVTRQAVMDLTV